MVFGIGCAAAGILGTLLLVWKPWHLPPDWGDVPTWLTFGAAGAGTPSIA